MKKVFNYIYTRPIFILMIIIVIVFVPQVAFTNQDSERKAIATSIGVDKSGDEFEVSLVVFTPKASSTYSENYKLVSSKGTSVVDALNKLTINYGKEVALAHTNLIILNEEMVETNQISQLDHFVRSYNLSVTTSIIVTNGKAKELLTLSNNLNKSTSLTLEEIIAFSEREVFSISTNIETMYNGAYCPTKSSIIGLISISETDGIDPNEQSGASAGESSQSEQSGQSSGGSSQSGAKPKKINNAGEGILLKNGKKVAKLDNKIMLGINWLNARKTKGSVTVKNITNSTFKNAEITFLVENKKQFVKSSFIDGEPVYKVDLHLSLSLDEVVEEGRLVSPNLRENIVLDDKIKSEIQKVIQEEFNEGVAVLKQHNADTIGVYYEFNANNTKEFKKYLEQFEDETLYFSNVKFEITVDCELNN